MAHGESVRPSLLGRGAGVHEDILRGTDAEVSWEDIYHGKFEVAVVMGPRIMVLIGGR